MDMILLLFLSLFFVPFREVSKTVKKKPEMRVSKRHQTYTYARDKLKETMKK